MTHDAVYQYLDGEARKICGSLWLDMNKKEQMTAMLKVAIRELRKVK